jgi:hypothetical protein
MDEGIQDNYAALMILNNVQVDKGINDNKFIKQTMIKGLKWV